jgi:hypothetical protein
MRVHLTNNLNLISSIFSDCINVIILSVSESSGGHDPLFRKGVRRGVKARFQNVFDVGGFYVECQSEKRDDAFSVNENLVSASSGGDVEEGVEGEDIVQKSKLKTASRTVQRADLL